MTLSEQRKAVIAALVAGAGALSLLGACGTTGDDESTGNAETRTSPDEQSQEQPLSPAEEQGRDLFVDNCGTCHTLDAAGTNGSIGPNLDEAQVDEAEVLEVIANGGRGSGNMPANLVTGEDAQAVAQFVASQNPAPGD